MFERIQRMMAERYGRGLSCGVLKIGPLPWAALALEIEEKHRIILKPGQLERFWDMEVQHVDGLEHLEICGADVASNDDSG